MNQDLISYIMSMTNLKCKTCKSAIKYNKKFIKHHSNYYCDIKCFNHI